MRLCRNKFVISKTKLLFSRKSYMQQVLASDENAIFVDDDAHEVHDPRVACDARIFRVLFERG